MFAKFRNHRSVYTRFELPGVVRRGSQAVMSSEHARIFFSTHPSERQLLQSQDVHVLLREAVANGDSARPGPPAVLAALLPQSSTRRSVYFAFI